MATFDENQIAEFKEAFEIVKCWKTEVVFDISEKLDSILRKKLILVTFT